MLKIWTFSLYISGTIKTCNMNIYKAQKDQIVRTTLGKRIRIKVGQEFCGDRILKTDSVLLFVEADGEEDDVIFSAGQEFMDNFRFMWHANGIKYEKVEIVKRKRISK